MRVPILASLVAIALAPAVVQASGIYQWKDAKGVTHYTDSPPSSDYKQRNIYQPDPDTPATTTVAKPAENPACVTARGNIGLLNSQQGLQIDSYGDGKPDKTLGAEERANQLALAEATLKANCAPAN